MNKRMFSVLVLVIGSLLGGEAFGQMIPKKVLGVTFDIPAVCRVFVNGQPLANYIHFEERPELGAKGMLWVKPGESFYFIRTDAIWNVRRNDYGEISVAGFCYADETLTRFVGGFLKKIHDNRYSNDTVMPSVTEQDFVTGSGGYWQNDHKINYALADEPVKVSVPPQPNQTILVSVANIGSDPIKVQLPLSSKGGSEILPPGSFRTYRFDYQHSISTRAGNFDQKGVLTVLGTFGRQSFVIPFPERDQWADVMLVSDQGVAPNLEHVYSFTPTSY